MPVLTRDETIARADAAIEAAIATLLAASNSLDRIAALKLLTQRTLRKNTQRNMRA